MDDDVDYYYIENEYYFSGLKLKKKYINKIFEIIT
jgi:hypothetical protein